MNTYTKKIEKENQEKVKTLLEKEGAKFDSVQYSLWRAKTPDYQVILYTSSKLLIQGKNIDKISSLIDEITGNTNQSLSNTDVKNVDNSELFDFNGEKYIGTDESGKGDYFGPLVVAGVQSEEGNKQKFFELGIKDSKKLDDNKILKLASIIKANCVHSVVVIMPEKYNELYSKFNNLNKLLAWAHARVIENILEKSYCSYALADKFGDESLIKNALLTKGKQIILKQCVRAESDLTVAAASILARAEFVKRMQSLSNKYEINFSKGVSSNVISQTREFVKKYSYNRLNEIAKLHFKTTNEIKY